MCRILLIRKSGEFRYFKRYLNLQVSPNKSNVPPPKQSKKLTVFALAVMEYAVDISKFGKNPMTLLVHQY